MENANFKVIYEDKEVLVINKPAGIIVFREGEAKEKALIDYLIEKYPELKKVGKPPRYGIIHRLDKDTSGALLIAKTNKVLNFLQNEFKKRKVEKVYLALVAGIIKENSGSIKTLIGRDKSGVKQRAYPITSPFGRKKGARIAETFWKVKERFKNFTLVEVIPKTGRKHQIRVHFAYIGHPIAGDKLYSFKNQPILKGLDRQFLHAYQLKIKFPKGKTRVFSSNLPANLKEILNNLKKYEKT
jgi:23S rRNA pseudouridine1911/1915/1917 synthase